MENHNNAEMKKEDRQKLIDLGSDITRNSKGSIYTLTISGQEEGQKVLPENVKTTK